METEATAEKEMSPAEALQESWATLTADQRHEGFFSLPREEAEELFISISAADQYELIKELPNPQKRVWIRLLSPDDTADLIQQFPHDERAQMLALLDIATMREVVALLAYAEDDAGGLMNPRFIRLRPDVPVDVA